MALSLKEATKIIDVVAADVSCRAVIDDPLALGSTFGWAGSIRNLALIIGGMYDSDRSHFDRVSCVGISVTTSEAINAQSVRGKKSGTPALTTVRNSSICSRVLSGVHHQSTWIVMTDMSEYVFDWHATLNVRNPLISRRVPWSTGSGGVQFVSFPAAGWR